MNSGLPHSAVIDRHLDEYVDDCVESVEKSSAQYLNAPSSKAIFKNSLACFCVLSSYSKRDLVLLKAAAEIARKIPFLISIRQYSLTYVELRRFCELICWYPYFLEHPIEWEEFQANPTTGLTKDLEKPISFAAHRERSFYANYCRERFAADRSGLAKKAVNEIGADHTILSIHVHAKPAALGRGKIGNIFETIDAGTVNKLASLQKRIFANGIIIVSAMNPKKISSLPPIERAWFDWIIGKTRAKTVRSGEFRIP